MQNNLIIIKKSSTIAIEFLMKSCLKPLQGEGSSVPSRAHPARPKLR
jgi:hypothetical protein